MIDACVWRHDHAPAQYLDLGAGGFRQQVEGELGGPWLVVPPQQPLAAAAAGTTFTMKQPFEFAIDPADLLDDEAEPDRAGSPTDKG